MSEGYEAIVLNYIRSDLVIYHGCDGKDGYTVHFHNGKPSFGKRCETTKRLPFHNKIINHFHLEDAKDE